MSEQDRFSFSREPLITVCGTLCLFFIKLNAKVQKAALLPHLGNNPA